ncbi:MAG: TonB-dependent receptor [Archangiaceae bacterium]|nr:TonB-dependent receptor [Archangiaceae bacterium]
MTLLVVALLLAQVDAGAADPTPDEGDLTALLSEPIVAAASRTTETAQGAPATTWSISGTDLKRYGIQSVEEAIRFLGHGMTSYEYDGRQSAAFGARGYMSDQLGLHLAVLIDGNQAGASAKTARGAQPYLMPIELVDHIDIVIGPGSVVYGNSAMLGIVNVITKTGASLDGTHVVVQASAGTPGDVWAENLSWGEAWTRVAAYGGFTTTLKGAPFDLAWHWAARVDRQQGRAVWHRDTTVADPFGDPLAAYDRENAFNRDFGSRLFMRATWGKWRALAWFALTAGTGTGPVDASVNSNVLEPEYGLDVAWASAIGTRGDLSLRLYGVLYDSQAVLGRKLPDPAFCTPKVATPQCTDTLRWVAFYPVFEPIFSWDWLRDGSHVTTVGGQAFIYGSVITTGVSALDGPAQQNDPPVVAPIPNGALYLQHIWHGRFGALNLGLRGDLGYLGSAVSPRLAYSVSPWNNGTLKLIFSTGFRTPTITERYLEIEGFVTESPDIRPERVYSGEVVLAQRFARQNVQLSLYGGYWEGMITTARVLRGGQLVNQFQNLRNIWTAGVNLGWRGEVGPVDWALSLNYAPGRVRLPGNAAGYSDQQLSDVQISREAVQRFGATALGSTFLPADSMPNFYATGHLSWALGPRLPRLSAAVSISSPRMRSAYVDAFASDPRLSQSPLSPWSADVRLAASHAVTDRVGLALFGTFRTYASVAEAPRVGNGESPLPRGGIGIASNPQAPVSVMAEVNVRL